MAKKQSKKRPVKKQAKEYRMQSPRYIWHPKVHTDLAGESQCFFRVGILYTYDREKALRAVTQALDTKGICAYSIWSLTGELDLLISVWLRGCDAEGFTRLLTETITAFGWGSLHIDYFEVKRTISHWLFPSPEGSGMSLPNIPAQMSSPLVDKVNSGQAEDELIASYIKMGLLSDYYGSRIKGIAFIVAIKAPRVASSGDHFERELQEIISSQTHVSNISLHYGIGTSEIRFMLLGRVVPKEFESIEMDLISRINRAGWGEYTARTVTTVMLGGDGGPIACKEQLVLRGQVTELDLQKVFQIGESGAIEIKGSAFTNMNRWLKLPDGQRIKVEDDKVTNEGWLRGTVALLNAKGGHVIVGALEIEEKKFHPEQWPVQGEKLPVIGKHMICGVEFEYKVDWDNYQQRLMNLVKERIEPTPSTLIEISPHLVEGRTVAVIHVTATNQCYYFIKGFPQFFVREAGQTQSYVGSEAEDYKRRHPRPLR